MKKTNIKIYLLVLIILVIGFITGRYLLPSNQTIKSSNHQKTSSSEDQEYTCSMHPQIRQNEPGDCPICGMDLIKVSQTSDKKEKSPFVYNMSHGAMALANVQTQKVKIISPEHEINLTGKIAVNEQNLAVITANYSGRIEKLFIDFTGQSVRKGQKLASIYSPDLVTAQKELIESAKFKEVNPALYNASVEKLRLWKITKEQINNIEKSGEVLTEFDVYADQAGIVVRRDISNGDYVNRGTVLFEIADLSKVWVLLDAYESDLPFIQNKQKITITTTSIPGEKFTSHISFIDPFINSNTRTASIRAELNNPQQRLKPEMFVRGTIKAKISGNEETIVIPNTSLLWTGKRSLVYVKVPNTDVPSFEMREVTIGSALRDHYTIESGLSEGEEVVTNGVFSIDAAAQLNGKYSMMNKPPDKRAGVPDKFANQLTNMLLAYFDLQNSLVKTDFKRAKSNANTLDSAFRKIDMNLLDNEPHAEWMEHHRNLKKMMGHIRDADDIDQLRNAFAPLSKQMIETVEAFHVKADAVYIVFCPMALNDDGAYWLSDSEEINNPYFGDKMLRCGEVKKKIEVGGNQEPKTNQPKGHQH